MGKRAISTRDAPAAIGPYSQAVEAGPFVFTAGQVGLDPETGELAGADVESQARRALRNLRAVLQEAGLGMEDVVKTTVFLSDLDEYEPVNEIYAEFFDEPFPARSAVAAGRLPRDARVEIEAIALRP